MADHEPLQEIEYESLPGGSLASNLAAGAFAGIMVRIFLWCFGFAIHTILTDMLSHFRNMWSCTQLMRSKYRETLEFIRTNAYW